MSSRRPANSWILSAEFTADTAHSILQSEEVAAAYSVKFGVDPGLQISVSVEVTERYSRPGKADADVLMVHPPIRLSAGSR